MARYVDLEAFRAEPLVKDPFPHLVMQDFVRAGVRDEVMESYPRVQKPGSWPLPGLHYGAAFREMIAELEGEPVRNAFEEKFQVDLTGHPTMITARCMCRAKDGKVHTDSRSKIITVLIYLNDDWEHRGGNLRLLRSPDLDDAFHEVPPQAGTLIAFLNSTNAWHGHASYSGPRRAIQLNWVQDQAVVERERKRHRVSGFFKKLNPFA